MTTQNTTPYTANFVAETSVDVDADVVGDVDPTNDAISHARRNGMVPRVGDLRVSGYDAHRVGDVYRVSITAVVSKTVMARRESRASDKASSEIDWGDFGAGRMVDIVESTAEVRASIRRGSVTFRARGLDGSTVEDYLDDNVRPEVDGRKMGRRDTVVGKVWVAPDGTPVDHDVKDEVA